MNYYSLYTKLIYNLNILAITIYKQIIFIQIPKVSGIEKCVSSNSTHFKTHLF